VERIRNRLSLSEDQVQTSHINTLGNCDLNLCDLDFQITVPCKLLSSPIYIHEMKIKSVGVKDRVETNGWMDRRTLLIGLLIAIPLSFTD